MHVLVEPDVWYNGRTLEPSLIQTLGVWNYNADDWQSIGGKVMFEHIILFEQI